MSEYDEACEGCKPWRHQQSGHCTTCGYTHLLSVDMGTRTPVADRERDAVVAYLRREADSTVSDRFAVSLRTMADLIECNEHRGN